MPARTLVRVRIAAGSRAVAATAVITRRRTGHLATRTVATIGRRVPTAAAHSMLAPGDHRRGVMARLQDGRATAVARRTGRVSRGPNSATVPTVPGGRTSGTSRFDRIAIGRIA
ncbi:MAG TPA: hypothetical protein VKC59_07670, partial [Candidatus Limnocylindrales bacterium]|nr:hypothetical protein [Candidatus Limnocylindrales bacterium]